MDGFQSERDVPGCTSCVPNQLDWFSAGALFWPRPPLCSPYSLPPSGTFDPRTPGAMETPRALSRLSLQELQSRLQVPMESEQHAQGARSRVMAVFFLLFCCGADAWS